MTDSAVIGLKKSNPGIDRKEKINAEAIILLVSVGVHIAFFIWNLFIGGVHVDEAMTVLNAKSLAENQTDILGERLPVYFDTWLYGGQSPMATYAVALSVKIFGASLFAYRLPALIMSLCGLFAYNSFVKNIIDSKDEQLVFLALGAFSPWHIFSGVYLLDCNFYPHILMIAIMFFVKAIKGGRSKHYIISMIFFGLSFYCYIASAIITPVFLAFTFIALLIKKKISFKNLVLSAFAVFSVSLVFILFGLVVLGVTEPFSFLGFSISDMPDYSRVNTLQENIADRLAGVIFDIIILTFPDIAASSVPNSIFLYTNTFGGIFALIGSVYTVFKAFKKDKSQSFVYKLIPAAFLFTVFVFFVAVASNLGTLYRFGALFFFLVFFEGTGLCTVAKKAKRIELKKLASGFVCLSLIVFTLEFSFIYKPGIKDKTDLYGDAFYESVEFVEEQSGKDDFTVCFGETGEHASGERVLVFIHYYLGDNEKLLPFSERINDLSPINEDIQNETVETVSITTDDSIKIKYLNNVPQLTDDYNIVYKEHLKSADYSQDYAVKSFGTWCVVYRES